MHKFVERWELAMDPATVNNRRSRAEPEKRKGELTPFVGGEMLRAPPLYAEENNNGACRGSRELQAGPR